MKLFLISQFLLGAFSKSRRFDSNTIKIFKKHSCPNDIECLFIQPIFRKCKRLLRSTCQSSLQNDQYYFNYLDEALDTSSSYESFLLIGDFNIEIMERCIESLLYKHELVKEKPLVSLCKIPVL